MLRQGPGLPLPGTVIHQRIVHTTPTVPQSILIASPSLPPAPVAVAVVTPAHQPRHGVKIVHHGHDHHPGVPKLVGIHKPKHVHHTRVIHGHTHSPAILPGHSVARGQQPSLRDMASSSHGTSVHAVRATHVSTAPHPTTHPHPAHPSQTSSASAPVTRRVIHR